MQKIPDPQGIIPITSTSTVIISYQWNYVILEIQPPYGGLLSSSCGGRQPSGATERPFGDFAGQRNSRMDRRRDGQTVIGLKEIGYHKEP